MPPRQAAPTKQHHNNGPTPASRNGQNRLTHQQRRAISNAAASTTLLAAANPKAISTRHVNPNRPPFIMGATRLWGSFATAAAIQQKQKYLNGPAGSRGGHQAIDLLCHQIATCKDFSS
jgi:hypothetical protein